MANSSSPHTDNQENNILVLGEGRIQGINDSTGAAEKKVLTSVKQIQNVGYVYSPLVMGFTCLQIKQIFTNLRQKIT